MSGMGQHFGRSFLQVAFDRFASPELVDFIRRWKIDLDEVKSLERTSAKIQALSDDAELKQFTSGSVKLWFDHLKQLLYDAEDVLDEYATQLLRLKLESQFHENHPHQIQQSGTKSAVKGINETMKGNIGSKVYTIVEELHGMTGFASKVRDINDKLKSEVQEGVDLGLNLITRSGSSRPRIFSEGQSTGSSVNISNVFGRDEDISKIVKWLLPSDKTPSPSKSDCNFSVLSIVGIGGSGKTTLAQRVYNDVAVENSRHFHLKAWVCVSEDFDEARLIKDILESAIGSSPVSNSLDALQRKLKETLSRKRFLLVLDDMWNEEYERWDALITSFAFGLPGSKILVTTRSKRVSSMVCPVPNDHDLKGLSPHACLDIIRKHAFMDGNSSYANLKLDVFGQAIVEKCKCLPLAVKTLAGLLRGKMENSEWQDILENEIWELEEGKILPSLMLSYHHLPPLLKRCFAYCALFPKDHVFNKIELVMLWMAEGFVQPKRRKRPEDIGDEYFDELFKRSFFELSDRPHDNLKSPFVEPNLISPFVQPDQYYAGEESFYELSNKLHMRSFFESSSNMGSGFVMHDLIHDLAQFVSDGMYCRRENDKPANVLTSLTRHFSYLTDNGDIDATKFGDMKSLRTFVHSNRYYFNKAFDDEPLPTMQFQFLRVLRIRNSSIHELPDSIGTLKHLRFLDLSFSENIVKLPDSITSLYGLKTLILTGCWNLGQLPEDISNLVNLRHLFLPVWSFSSYKMPLMGMGNLTNLQTLSPFVVGSNNRGELRDLSQLRGTLDISKLENAGNINATEAMVANLRNKPHLLGLRLCWGEDKSAARTCYLGRDEKVEEDLLDQLQPHTNLELLWIQNYGGTRCPSWMDNPSCFSNLQTVGLFNCHKCRFLPCLRQLPLLKNLVIQGCNAIESVGSKLLDGDDSSSSSATKKFRSLETLRILYIEWEEWLEGVEEQGEEGGGGQFPCLRELIIKICPKLKIFRHCFPALEELEIYGCDNLRELPRFLSKLRRLCITYCPKVAVLPSLPSIETLNLTGCEQIISLSSTTSAPCVHNSLPSLRELIIENCPSLRELPSILPSLELLEISNCHGMVLNNEMLPHLSSLSSLIISLSDEADRKSLPNRFVQQLTALQELSLGRCILPKEIGSNHLPPSLQDLSILDCDNVGKLLQSMCNLHRLEFLSISNVRGVASLPEVMHNLTSLQELYVSDCENLELLPKGLHSLTSLQRFEIQSCPALVSFPETGLPIALQQLKITNCENLESLPKELHTLMSLQLFNIQSCPAIVSFPEIGLPTVLQQLKIENCKNLNSLPKGLHTLTSLQHFEIRSCPAIVSFPETGLPTGLQQLEIEDCKNLNSLPKGLHTLTSLQHFKIRSCPAIVSFPETGLPIALQQLEIEDCKNLNSLPKGLHTLTSLQHFKIQSYPALVSFPETGLPTVLQNLWITDCENLEALPKELHTLTSLQLLNIQRCPALVSFPETGLPTALQQLEIGDCENLESLPKGLHTPLQHFKIRSCPALVSFPETGLPIALRQLEIEDCKNLESLPMGLLHKLPSLRRLIIRECPALESFPDMGFPTSLRSLFVEKCGKLNLFPNEQRKLAGLQELKIDECSFSVDCKNQETLRYWGLHSLNFLSSLTIIGCPALISITKGMLPTYLQQFYIEDCPILESLHDGLSDLKFLKWLEIRKCPMLKQRWQEKEGEEWSKIAHILDVVVDGECF